jgi:ATP-dependent RNA helicase DeaD
MDMHERGLLPYNQVKMAVLDEVDRMLDIGFRDDIRRILGSMKEHPQTVFVSATISPEIEKLARSYMRDAEKIVTTEKSLTVSQVDQSYLGVEHWDKRRLLHHLLTHETPELTVVFCRTKRTVDDVAEYLQKKGIDAHPIHGDMYQRARDKVMERLRGGSLSVLVASDLASSNGTLALRWLANERTAVDLYASNASGIVDMGQLLGTNQIRVGAKFTAQF